MKYAHLPAPGGLYDQHYKLFGYWMVIWEAEAEEEKRDAARREREQEQKMHAAKSRGGIFRGRRR